MVGTLYVVATPIGNLEDLSFRALRILKEVDLIAAEDTRRTSKLLAHYGIRKSMTSFHEHNEVRETPRLIARLTAGTSVALVSDAGTPGIADPGAYLVRAARAAGILVSPIPGPSAVMAALSASGVPGSEFVFMGFPPRSGAARIAWFARLSGDPRTVVFFEAPHRIQRTLAEVVQRVAERPINIHRELTKINEEYIVSPNTSKEHGFSVMGEFVVVVGPEIGNRESAKPDPELLATSVKVFGCLTNNDAFLEVEALDFAAKALSLEASAVRKAVKKARIAQKQRDESLS